jgi:hypothetical protein
MAGLLGTLQVKAPRIGKEQLGTLAPVVRAFFQSFVKAPEPTQLRLPGVPPAWALCFPDSGN